MTATVKQNKIKGELVSGVWARIMAHKRELERIVKASARCDSRLNADDMIADLWADIAESEERLWDPERGEWMAWARTRAWKVRTYHLRDLNKHAPKGAASRLTIAPQPSGTDLDSSLVEPAISDGGWGHASRSESTIELDRLSAAATTSELAALIAVAEGRDIAMSARPRIAWELKRLARRGYDPLPILVTEESVQAELIDLRGVVRPVAAELPDRLPDAPPKARKRRTVVQAPIPAAQHQGPGPVQFSLAFA